MKNLYRWWMGLTYEAFAYSLVAIAVLVALCLAGAFYGTVLFR